MFFKSKEEKENEIYLLNVVASLKKQILDAITVIKWSKKDTLEYDKRIKDNFTWGYINGFLWTFLDSLDVDKKKKEKYERKALKKLFPSFGIQVMAEVKETKEENIMFGLGEEYAEEDFNKWKKEDAQPKKLAEFIIRGDKAVNLDV